MTSSWHTSRVPLPVSPTSRPPSIHPLDLAKKISAAATTGGSTAHAQAEAASRPNRDEAKARGNAAFSAGHFEEAAGHFGDAITLAPDNHILFSNRSVAYASLGRYKEVLVDADRTVALSPDWAKGYSRLGAARLGLGDAAGAVEAYEKGLTLEPSNVALKDGLTQARWALSRRPASGADAIGIVFNFGGGNNSKINWRNAAELFRILKGSRVDGRRLVMSLQSSPLNSVETEVA
ncbi:hypothetical protein ZWY2020_006421 [Hordeum vulgare]|nr:hypothetical protein ZWY2020_006421 [Hordeum vulgare]